MNGGNASQIFKFCGKWRWFISLRLLLLYTQGSFESLVHLFAYLLVVLMEGFLLNYKLCFLINCIPLQIRYYILDTVIIIGLFISFALRSFCICESCCLVKQVQLYEWCCFCL